MAVSRYAQEAQGGQSKADFISKMTIALKEARATRVRLRITRRVIRRARNETCAPHSGGHEELKRVIGALIVSAKRNNNI